MRKDAINHKQWLPPPPPKKKKKKKIVSSERSGATGWKCIQKLTKLTFLQNMNSLYMYT